ncbi:hypothetical protein H0H81_012644 [Sphagnurus paluster]|uniref:Protein kinase domain-containing protein n=1 Tax=Sphagnurus paluster TaxID=117069 RepID=A0A9P7FNA3_9AGAR|nr:hypothetical protein H0H81_012644 [Sphagnurus paluster]
MPRIPISSLSTTPANRDIPSLIDWLESVFKDSERYRLLMRWRKENAQFLLDLFQWLLDKPDLEQNFRRQLIVAAQRLSTKSALYPACYAIEHVELESDDPIAAGGFCDIFKGYLQDQAVSLKTIRIYEKDAIEHVLKKFSKEAILWGQLSHPNVLPTYGLYRFRRRVCVISPWMEAGDVNKYLKNNPDVDRLQLAYDVVEGLLYLHRNGIIHGDLKGVRAFFSIISPDSQALQQPNILVNDAGRACLADFGISSVVDEKILAWTSHSSALSKGGSVRWQAPELFDLETDKFVPNTTESDVYAWACVCYEIFTGDSPFAGMSDSGVIYRIMSGQLPSRPPDSSPAWQSWGLTENIWILMHECWAKSPKKRPTTKQLLQRLTPWLISDQRSSASDSVLAPATFRAKAGPPIRDLDSVATLEFLLHLNKDPGPLSPEERTPSGPEFSGSPSGTSLYPATAFGRRGSVSHGISDVVFPRMVSRFQGSPSPFSSPRAKEKVPDKMKKYYSARRERTVDEDDEYDRRSTSRNSSPAHFMPWDGSSIATSENGDGSPYNLHSPINAEGLMEQLRAVSPSPVPQMASVTLRERGRGQRQGRVDSDPEVFGAVEGHSGGDDILKSSLTRKRKPSRVLQRKNPKRSQVAQASETDED